MQFQMAITFFLGVVWKKRKQVSFRDFYEVFEKQHRGTQKPTRTHVFGCGRLGVVFGYLRKNTKSGFHKEIRKVIYVFFSGNSFDIFGPAETSVTHFPGPQNILRPIFGEPTCQKFLLILCFFLRYPKTPPKRPQPKSWVRVGFWVPRCCFSKTS